MPATPLVDGDLVTRALEVKRRDVVFVRGVIEGSEGIGVMFAERGGELVIAAPRSRTAALDELIRDLTEEIDARVSPDRKIF